MTFFIFQHVIPREYRRTGRYDRGNRRTQRGQRPLADYAKQEGGKPKVNLPMAMSLKDYAEQKGGKPKVNLPLAIFFCGRALRCDP